MKKQLILGSFLALTSIANAQNSFPIPNGNVAVGVSPAIYKLDISSSVTDDALRFTQTGNGSSRIILKNTTTGGREWSINSLGNANSHGAGNFALYDLTAGLNRLFISGGYNSSIPAGYVGIGTTSPAARLDVVGAQMGLNANDKSSYFQLSSLSGSNTDYLKIFDKRHTAGNTWQGTELRIQKSVDAADKHYISFKGGATNSSLNFGFGNTDLVSVLDNGNVGIGNTAPAYKFEVQSSVANDGISITQTNAHAAALHITNNSAGGKHWAIFSTGNGNAQGSGHFSIYDYSVFADRFFISGGSTNPLIASGNIGIGTNAPKSKLSVNGNMHIGSNTAQGVHNDYKLSVEGKIVAQSLYITVANGTNWADYVFADDYKLQSLYEIEKYYKANKHLSEIPTTAEITEKGIDVGEMNVLLLKKIEELTIHVVEQQKQIDALNAKIK